MISSVAELSAPKGTLFIVATPIGNLKDITLRALETLRECHIILAEDTRVTRKLLSYYDIHKPLIIYNDHTEEREQEEILSKIHEGHKLALVTDSGMPGISDPGYRLIRSAIEKKLEVTVIPGPSAVLSALVISALPPYPFVFLGFPPPRGTKREEFFRLHGNLPFTKVIFESPKRILKTLKDIKANWDDPLICLAKELTKLYEETFRGQASEVIETLEGIKPPIRGEYTIVVEGAKQDEVYLERSECIEMDRELQRVVLLDKEPVSKIAKEFASRFNMPRREIYKKAMKIKESLTKKHQ